MGNGVVVQDNRWTAFRIARLIMDMEKRMKKESESKFKEQGCRIEKVEKRLVDRELDLRDLKTRMEFQKGEVSEIKKDVREIKEAMWLGRLIARIFGAIFRRN